MDAITVIAEYGDLCGEGPVWDANTGCLYWTDIEGRRFFRYRHATGKHEIVKQGLEISGYALNRPSGFVIANSRGIWLWDGADQLKLIVDRVGTSLCQINDAVADPEGRFFAGSNFYDPSRDYELGKLIRVDTDGAARIIDEGFNLANGMAFAPDETVFYFADSGARRIYAYDYTRVTGALRNRRVLIQVPGDEGVPDGLTVDAAGFLWSAQWYGGCVVRYDPDGKVERRISFPAKQVSSVAFGGPELTDVFVTSASKSWPSPLMPKSYDPVAGNFGGQLFHMNLEIKGKLDYRADIRIR
jgi:sugar lactone lactonase YvrE